MIWWFALLSLLGLHTSKARVDVQIENLQHDAFICQDARPRRLIGDLRRTLDNIHDLYCVVSITGKLQLYAARTGSDSMTTSLRALSNLTTVSGELGIYNDDQLTSLDGLQNLRSVGSLKLLKLPQLDDISALHNLSGELSSLHPVSYTHLRAHETVLDLVCRLLLEKKHKINQSHIDATSPPSQ